MKKTRGALLARGLHACGNDPLPERLKLGARTKHDVATWQRRDVAQDRRRQANILVEQVFSQQEPGHVVLAKALRVGQVGVELGVAGGDVVFKRGQPVLLLGADQERPARSAALR